MSIRFENKVGIIGAGLAGLTVAYRLTKWNIPTIIFLANNRV